MGQGRDGPFPVTSYVKESQVRPTRRFQVGADDWRGRPFRTDPRGDGLYLPSVTPAGQKDSYCLTDWKTDRRVLVNRPSYLGRSCPVRPVWGRGSEVFGDSGLVPTRWRLFGKGVG